MDIPLPDDPLPEGGLSLENIPVPEDRNRYSPSVPIEDDPIEAKPNLAEISLPAYPPKYESSKAVVLGKSAAKKRLLAFSMAKQNIAQPKKNKSDEEKPSDQVVSKKKLKKGVVDKARDTICEIEELKRQEKERESLQSATFPLWTNPDDPNLLLKADHYRVSTVENLLESVIKKTKSEPFDYEKRKRDRYDSDEGRYERRDKRDKRDKKENRDKRDKEKEQSEPKNWGEFTKAGFQVYHFRRHKYKWEKYTNSSKRRTKCKSAGKVNLLNTPMVLRKPISVKGINDDVTKEFPSWGIKFTSTRPSISYSINPEHCKPITMTREEMLETLPDDIHEIVSKFLKLESFKRFKVPDFRRLERKFSTVDEFLIPSKKVITYKFSAMYEYEMENEAELNYPSLTSKWERGDNDASQDVKVDCSRDCKVSSVSQWNKESLSSDKWEEREHLLQKEVIVSSEKSEEMNLGKQEGSDAKEATNDVQEKEAQLPVSSRCNEKRDSEENLLDKQFIDEKGTYENNKLNDEVREEDINQSTKHETFTSGSNDFIENKDKKQNKRKENEKQKKSHKLKKRESENKNDTYEKTLSTENSSEVDNQNDKNDSFNSNISDVITAQEQIDTTSKWKEENLELEQTEEFNSRIKDEIEDNKVKFLQEESKIKNEGMLVSEYEEFMKTIEEESLPNKSDIKKKSPNADEVEKETDDTENFLKVNYKSTSNIKSPTNRQDSQERIENAWSHTTSLNLMLETALPPVIHSKDNLAKSSKRNIKKKKRAVSVSSSTSSSSSSSTSSSSSSSTSSSSSSNSDSDFSRSSSTSSDSSSSNESKSALKSSHKNKQKRKRKEKVLSRKSSKEKKSKANIKSNKIYLDDKDKTLHSTCKNKKIITNEIDLSEIELPKDDVARGSSDIIPEGKEYDPFNFIKSENVSKIENTNDTVYRQSNDVSLKSDGPPKSPHSSFKEQLIEKTLFPFKRHFNIDMFNDKTKNQVKAPSPQHSNNIFESKPSEKNSIDKQESNDDSQAKYLELYSPTVDDDEEENDNLIDNAIARASSSNSHLDDNSQIFSFGVNSASEEARMLDIPLPPPLPEETPLTSFHNILQQPLCSTSPKTTRIQIQLQKSPIARLTFGKQVTKLKPLNVFSEEDSDSNSNSPKSSVAKEDVRDENLTTKEENLTCKDKKKVDPTGKYENDFHDEEKNTSSSNLDVKSSENYTKGYRYDRRGGNRWRDIDKRNKETPEKERRRDRVRDRDRDRNKDRWRRSPRDRRKDSRKRSRSRERRRRSPDRRNSPRRRNFSSPKRHSPKPTPRKSPCSERGTPHRSPSPHKDRSIVSPVKIESSGVDLYADRENSRDCNDRVGVSPKRNQFNDWESPERKLSPQYRGSPFYMKHSPRRRSSVDIVSPRRGSPHRYSPRKRSSPGRRKSSCSPRRHLSSETYDYQYSPRSRVSLERRLSPHSYSPRRQSLERHNSRPYSPRRYSQTETHEPLSYPSRGRSLERCASPRPPRRRSPERVYSNRRHVAQEINMSPRPYSPQRRDSPYRREDLPLSHERNSPRAYSPRRHSLERKRSPNTYSTWRHSPQRRESPRPYSPRKHESNYERDHCRESSYFRESPFRSKFSPERIRRRSPDRGDKLSPGRAFNKRPSSPIRMYSPSPGRSSHSSPPHHPRSPKGRRRSFSLSPPRGSRKWEWNESSVDREGMKVHKHFPQEKHDFKVWENYNKPHIENDFQTSLADSTISDSELVKESSSPKRPSLDERLKLVLGDNFETSKCQAQPTPQLNEEYYYYHNPPPPIRCPYPPAAFVRTIRPPRIPAQWDPTQPPPPITKVVQVGNVLQVVPSDLTPVDQIKPQPKLLQVPKEETKAVQVVQVGNVLQVVPSQIPTVPSVPSPVAVPVQVLPVPPPVIVPAPAKPSEDEKPQPVSQPPAASVEPVLLAINPPAPEPPRVNKIKSLPLPPGHSPDTLRKIEDRQRRKEEKEIRKKKKEEKAARKLRKTFMRDKLTIAEEQISAELNKENDNVPDVVRTTIFPPPDKGILLTMGFGLLNKENQRKTVSFADGIKPGEGTSPSGGEEHPLSPPPNVRKTVRRKKKKRKVKVRLRVDGTNTKVIDDDEEDYLSPPPPPPGTPPPEAYYDYTNPNYVYPPVYPREFKL